jgi:hypothetical protein
MICNLIARDEGQWVVVRNRYPEVLMAVIGITWQVLVSGTFF